MKTILCAILLLLFVYPCLSAQTSVRIGRVHTTTPSQDITLEITLENDSGFQSGGFDFIIQVHPAFSVESVTAGPLLSACDWEYFTYSDLNNSNYHITAFAETSNGPYHPSCFADTSGTLAVITLSTDSVFSNCGFFPLKWHWLDCGDNSFASRMGDSLYLSNQVFDFDGHEYFPIAQDTTFPSIYGAPEICMPNPREVDFYNGGIWVILSDTWPPVISCNQDTTVYNDPDQCGAVVEFPIYGWDNCGAVDLESSPASGSMFQIGESTVHCLARDVIGNIDTCLFTVTVIDTQAPQVICPNDTVVANDSGSCGAIVQFMPGLIDNCPDAYTWCNPSAGYNFPIGTTEVMCAAFDNAGFTDTGYFNVTVVDVEPPRIDCPEDILVNSIPDSCGGILDFVPNVTDNCPGVTYSMQPPSGAYIPLGSYPVEIIATDTSGLSDTCVFTATIVDSERPVIACPDTIIVTADSGQCGAVATYSASATDNCGEVNFIYNPPSGSFFPVGVSDVTGIAVDPFGNADTCLFKIVVEDSDPPILTVPELVFSPADSGMCGAIMTFELTAEDNCTGTQITAVPPSGSFFEIGETMVTVTAFDDFGNSDSGQFVVFVFDKEPPVVSCPEDIAVMNDSGYYGAFVSFTYDAEDNCDSFYIISEPAAESLFPIGGTEVSVIAIDEGSNRDTCHFIVSVSLIDEDSDGYADWDDNCVADFNPGQDDSDDDGLGDVCDWRYGDANGDDEFNVGDVVFIISFIFNNGAAPQPLKAGDSNCDGETNIGDAVFLINHIFNFGPGPDCN